MTRRQLLAASAAMGSMAQKGAAATDVYASALDGFESKVRMETFDPVAWSRTLYRQASLKMTFRATSRKQAEGWQKKLRPRVAELIGLKPASGPLNPQTLEVRDFPQYKREKVVFESVPGLSVLAYLLTPASAKPPYPVMICVPGHGRGVDDIVGVDEKGRDRTNKSGYQHDFAIQAAERGIAAVAIEPMAFGCRRDPISRKKGLGNSACQPTAGAALLLGETMIAWRVRDVMRTIDWVRTRKELDSARLGCMGISGGGTCTLFASALDERIRVAFVSGYLNTFLESVFSLSHCIDNYVPGILEWAEMYDVAGLIAPRPLFVESGDKDNIFPIEASKASFERVKKVYETLGAADLAAQEVFAGEHAFWGRGGFAFVEKHLKA
jgi:dienelactone hydrolase